MERSKNDGGIINIGVEKIVPNPFQPRIRFNEIELDELADSIRQHGVMQPIVVACQNSGGYEALQESADGE